MLDVVPRQIPKVMHGKSVFLLSQAKQRARRTWLPSEKEEVGKCSESLAFTVKVGESTRKDRGDNGVAAVQSELAQSG